MTRITLAAAALAIAAGMATPAAADYVRLGSVDVGWNVDRDSQWTRFGGRMEGLRLEADHSDIYCSSISVRYGNGDRDRVFSGRLRENDPVYVDLRGGSRRVDRVDFTCRSSEFRGGRIYVEADVGRYRDEWRGDPDWSRMWSGLFGGGGRWDSRDNTWVRLGTETFEGRHDSETTFSGGWRGHSVDRIGLRPIDNDARCRSIVATFGNGERAELSDRRRLQSGQVNVFDIPGRDRNIARLDLSCRSLGDRRVTIEILTRH